MGPKIRRFYRMLFCLGLPILSAACVHMFGGGDRQSVSTTVRFVDASGVPVRHEEAFIVERVDTSDVVTSVTATDANGAVSIARDICLPASVFVKGGNFVLKRGMVPDRGVVEVVPNGTPLRQVFRVDPTYTDYALRRGDCG